jgi:hypothetical protein
VGEIVALKQKRLAGHLRQGIREAVTKIQTGCMAAFSIFAPCEPRNLNLFGIGRDYLELRTMQEEIELATRSFAPPRFQYNTCFESIDRRDAPSFGLGQRLQELPSLWLCQKDRKQC